MNPPSTHPSAGHDRKRKRPSRQSSSETSSHQQQTLQSLFAGQQKPNVNGAAPPSPDQKRSRATCTPPKPTPAQARVASEMYAFPSRSLAANGIGNGVIDLTSGTPPTSPTARRVNGARSGVNNSHIGAKKLVVKNLKSNTQWDSKTYLEKIWGQLDEALAFIFKGRFDGFSKEDLYKGVENVCRQGGASTLYSRLERRCGEHVEKDMRDSLFQKVGQEDVVVLEAALEEWMRWKEQMVTIRGIFFFLDRSYLLPSSKPTLAELTPQLFREIVFHDPLLKAPIVEGACELVHRDRTSTSSLEKTVFKQTVDMFHELSTYTSAFEERFLASTQHWIAPFSEEAITERSVPDYVRLADETMAKEMRRCEAFALDASTKRDLLQLLEDYLIDTKTVDLTEYEALAKLLDENATTDLKALYALLSRRKRGSQLRPAYEKWVDETGTAIVFAKDADNMIIELLSLKRRLDSMWQNCFQRDEQLGHALRETFSVFMNKTKKGDATWGTDNTKVGEMIAKYVNQLLQGGAKAVPEVLTARRASSITGIAPKLVRVGTEPTIDENDEDADVDEDTEINLQLDQVLDLFRFVQGKAVFEAFYKKDLARRLLMQRSASADAEKSMLTRLKTECGSGFTQNLEQMFRDVELAREEMQAYKKRLEDRIDYVKGEKVDLSVNILSAAAWPTYPDVPVIIPQKIQSAIDDFALHYKSKHSGRKLEWKHALAHCVMKAKFGKGTKELVLSSFQAVVLLLFHERSFDEQLSYQHILSETGLPEQEVKRTLQSLACAKLRPLLKTPPGREINTTDTFRVNLNFEHPKYRIKINQVQLKETAAENKETHERVAEDRHFETQAAIVRILKGRKRIAHAELIAEVIKATLARGRLEVPDIKKNIDRLIEKDYMEREEGNMYAYIA